MSPRCVLAALMAAHCAWASTACHETPAPRHPADDETPRATTGEEGVDEAPEPTPPTRDPQPLAALIAEALEKHPDLQRARHQADAASEVPSRAGSPPDPMFSVSAQNIRFDDPRLTASPMSAIQLGLMQTIPYPGKLSARHDAAAAAARTSDRQIAVLEAAVVLDVRRAYWQLSYAEAALDISTKSERVINTLTDSVHIRFSVAQAAQQDALQAQTAHSRLRAEVRRHEQLVLSARRRLNSAVGRPPTADVGSMPRPPKEGRKLSRKALLAQLQRTNPSLAVARANVHAAATAVEAAEQERWPDFQAGFMYRFRLASPGDMSAGADMFGVTLGVTLPVWMAWKQDARVRETQALRRAAAEGVSSIDLVAKTALETLIDAVRRLDEEITLYEKEVLPEADAALHASIEDYAFARVGFVSLLQNWRLSLDTELMLERLRTDRVLRLAEIDAVVGAPIQGRP